MNCQLQKKTIIYIRSWGAAYAEAKLLLARVVTVPSNGVAFQKNRDARSYQWCQAIMTSCVGLLGIAKSS